MENQPGRRKTYLKIETGSEGAISRFLKFVQDRTEDSGIVYCLSRKLTDRVARMLQKHQIHIAPYHTSRLLKNRFGMPSAPPKVRGSGV